MQGAAVSDRNTGRDAKQTSASRGCTVCVMSRLLSLTQIFGLLLPALLGQPLPLLWLHEVWGIQTDHQQILTGFFFLVFSKDWEEKNLLIAVRFVKLWRTEGLMLALSRTTTSVTALSEWPVRLTFTWLYKDTFSLIHLDIFLDVYQYRLAAFLHCGLISMKYNNISYFIMYIYKKYIQIYKHIFIYIPYTHIYSIYT